MVWKKGRGRRVVKGAGREEGGYRGQAIEGGKWYA
jgi:hypothetical protein